MTPAFKQFMVGSRIPNLTPTPSFDHNSCKSCLNEQWKAALSIYVSRTFLWCPGGPIWWFFSFSTKTLNIHSFCMSAIPKMGVHLGVIGLHPLHSPPFVKVCFTPKHIISASWTLALHI